MKQPPFEVADVIRQHGKSFIEKNRSWLTWLHVRVLFAIEHCRTAALGGHLDRCCHCGYEATSFNSCRSRHCLLPIIEKRSFLNFSPTRQHHPRRRRESSVDHLIRHHDERESPNPRH